MRIEQVRWYDSGLSIADGWMTPEEYLPRADTANMQAVTTGYLMHEDDSVVILALSYDPTHKTFYSAQVILKSNIIGRTLLAVIDAEVGSVGAIAA